MTGMEGYGAGGQGTAPITGLTPGPVFEPAFYIRRAMKLPKEAKVLIFACSIEHAHALAASLNELTGRQSAVAVTSKTSTS